MILPMFVLGQNDCGEKPIYKGSKLVNNYKNFNTYKTYEQNLKHWEECDSVSNLEPFNNLLEYLNTSNLDDIEGIWIWSLEGDEIGKTAIKKEDNKYVEYYLEKYPGLIGDKRYINKIIHEVFPEGNTFKFKSVSVDLFAIGKGGLQCSFAGKNKLTCPDKFLGVTLLYTLDKVIILDYDKLGLNKCIEGDCIDSKGIYSYLDGGLYDGEFLKSNRHGKGKMTYLNGDKYEGEWKNDLQHGHGIHTFANGEKLKGEFKKGKCSMVDLAGKHSFSLSEVQDKFPDHIVLNIDSCSIDESYNKTLGWIGLPSFSNKKDIISQRKNESIKIQGLNKIDINDQKFDVRYFLEFRFKDNRVKLNVLDAEIYFPSEIRTKIKWGQTLFNLFSTMIIAESANQSTSLVYFGSTTKDEYIPGSWEKLSFTYSQIIESNDQDKKNMIFQIINSFTNIARDLETHLNMRIEQEDDW